MNGFVYFISVPGRIKVGFATAPASRIKEIARHLECDPTLIGKIKGSIPLEHAIHARLAVHRLRGEWFEDNEIVRSTIAMILEQGPSSIGYTRPELSVPIMVRPTPQQDGPVPSALLGLARQVFPDDPCGGFADAFEVSREECQRWFDGERMARAHAAALCGYLILWMKPRSRGAMDNATERSAA